MANRERSSELDESLLTRVSSLSVGSQRWLKTALQAIRASEAPSAPSQPTEPLRLPRRSGQKAAKRAADLEDVLTGKADLREQLEAYPELAKEFEGLADVIDLLRDQGSRRRRRGEEILRELLEGEERSEDGDETPEH
jgi:hypothetical protein